MAKGINENIFPGNVNTAADKLEFAYRAQQLLMDLHNTFVKWRDDGLQSRPEWAALPTAIKQQFPYTEFINSQTWRRFHDDEFIPRMDSINEEILKHRTAIIGNPDTDDEEANEAYSAAKLSFKNSNRFAVNVGAINKFLRN